MAFWIYTLRNMYLAIFRAHQLSGARNVDYVAPQAGLLGFYDPCLGERKCLRVKYQFRSRIHEVTVDDRAPLEMPLRGGFKRYIGGCG